MATNTTAFTQHQSAYKLYTDCKAQISDAATAHIADMAEEETVRTLPGGVPFTDAEVAKAKHLHLERDELGPLSPGNVMTAALAKIDFYNGPTFRAKFKLIFTELLKLRPPPTVQEWRQWLGPVCAPDTLEIFYRTYSLADVLRDTGSADPAHRLAEAQLQHYEAQKYPQRRKVREAVERLGRLDQVVSTSFKSSFVDAAIAGKVDDVAIFFFCCLCMGEDGKRLTLAFFSLSPDDALGIYNAAVIDKMGMMDEEGMHGALEQLSTPFVYTDLPDLVERVKIHNRGIAADVTSQSVRGGSANAPRRSQVFTDKSSSRTGGAAAKDRARVAGGAPIAGGDPLLPVFTLSDGTQAVDGAPVKDQFDVVDRQRQQLQGHVALLEQQMAKQAKDNEQLRQQVQQLQQLVSHGSGAPAQAHAVGPMLAGFQPHPQAVFDAAQLPGAQQQGQVPMQQSQLPPYHMPQQAGPYVPSMNDLATALLNNARDNARAQSRHERDMRDLKALVSGRSRARRDGKGGGEDDSDHSSSDEPADKKKKSKAGFQ